MKKISWVSVILLLSIYNCSAQYVKLHDFPGAYGRYVCGDLHSNGAYLYGMTQMGGTYDYGVVYRIKPDGTADSVILNFNSVNGKNPFYGTLISDSAYLYGMTYFGGTNDFGTIFKVKFDGTGYTKLLDFSGAIDGKYPQGSLISDGTFLYGMTTEGGTSNLGTIFKIMPDGSGYTKLFDFTGALTGSHPYADLISDGSFLYGLTYEGGAGNFGTIFKIMPDGTNYSKMLDFNGPYGKWPTGSLIIDSSFLYGMAAYGGSSGAGTIFRIKPDGTGASVLHNFIPVNGCIPYHAALIPDGNFFYGLTSSGGTGNFGTIFRIRKDGSSYAKQLDFSIYTSGSSPRSSLISEGGSFYGTTYEGGISGWGTVFKFDPFPTCYAQYATAYDSIFNAFTLSVDSATTATAISYLWDFGDGATSTLATPSHVYTVDTVYNVCMKVFSVAGDSCTYCDSIGKDYLGNIIRSGFTINVYNQNIVTSVSQHSGGESQIVVFPNPATGLFYVTFSGKKSDGHLSVYNVIGEKVYDGVVERQNDMAIDLSDQPDGIYFLKIRTEDGYITRKIIVSK